MHVPSSCRKTVYHGQATGRNRLQGTLQRVATQVGLCMPQKSALWYSRGQPTIARLGADLDDPQGGWHCKGESPQIDRNCRQAGNLITTA